MASVILTVADHDQNGFVALARWLGLSEAEARDFIASEDALVTAEAEPDMQTAPFTFILDLIAPNGDCIDNGKRLLPTQNAMRLAPEQVQQWLKERPNPDSTDRLPIPEARSRAP